MSNPFLLYQIVCFYDSETFCFDSNGWKVMIPKQIKKSIDEMKAIELSLVYENASDNESSTIKLSILASNVN